MKYKAQQLIMQLITKLIIAIIDKIITDNHSIQDQALEVPENDFFVSNLEHPSQIDCPQCTV